MKKDHKEKLNYSAEVRLLREQGPEKLYMLFGPEDYLRETYLTELRGLCVPSEDEFSFQRFNGLLATGMADRITLEALFSENAKKNTPVTENKYYEEAEESGAYFMFAPMAAPMATMTSPMWLMEEYATIFLRSLWAIQAYAP